MSSDGNNGIVVRVSRSNLPDSMREIESLTDLFNLVSGDNYSVLEHDVEADGWPSLDDVENDDIADIMDELYAAVDIADRHSINAFADAEVKELENVYRRFGRSELLHNRIDHLNNLLEESAKLDAAHLIARLKPLLDEENEGDKGFWQKNFGFLTAMFEEEKEKPSPAQVKSLLVDVEMDLHRQSAEMRGISVKTERLIRDIHLHKEQLEQAQEDLDRAEASLYIAYIAGRKILHEWHSDEVMSLYIRKTQFQELAQQEIDDTDTDFYIPTTARNWADLTYSLNMRLTQFRNTFRSNQNMTVDIPDRVAAIDQMIEKYQNSNLASTRSWQETSARVHDMIEFVRNQQRLTELFERANKLAERESNHATYMRRIENAHKNGPHNRGKGPTWPKNAYDHIAAQSVKLKAEMAQQATDIDAEYKRLCDVSDYYRDKFELPLMQRVDSLSETMRSKAAKPAATNRKGWHFF